MTKKPWPVLRTDEEAEEFVANSDLTEYDFSQFVRVRFRFADQMQAVSIPLPNSLIDAVEAAASDDGITSEDFIRRTLEKAIVDRETIPAD